MTALTDVSDLINRATGGNSGTPENISFFKSARIAGAAATAPVAGRWASLWLYDGQPCAGPAPAGSAVYPTNTTAGGLQQVDPGGGRQKWITSLDGAALVGGTLMIYDRLAQYGGLSGTVTTAQTVNLTPTRYTDGLGNIAFIEINSAIGTTATTVTMLYDNQASGTSITGPAVVLGGAGFDEKTRMIMLPLAAGDYGIKQVRNIDLLASTVSAAGDMAVVIAHPLAYLSLNAPGVGCPSRDLFSGFPKMGEALTDACLAMAWLPNTTTVPEITGRISFVEA